MENQTPEEQNFEQEHGPEKETKGEKYRLYTEHIVKNPWEKVKRMLKKGAILVALAIVFGLIAGLVMIIVNHIGDRVFTRTEATTAEAMTQEPETTAPAPTESLPESVTHGDVTISIDDETTPAETESETGGEQNTEDLGALTEQFALLRSIAAKVNRSMVTVTVATENVDWFATTYQNITEESGLIIESKESGCYILTDYDLVRNAMDIRVTYPDGTVMQASLLAGDTTTGLAVIQTEPVSTETAVVATLANVSSIAQGDLLLAVGKLYGFAGGIGYGIATSTANYVSDTDSYFRLINTDINGTDSSAGVIANLNGEVVGIITTSYNSGNNSMITAYAISGITRLVENLSNSYETPYFGIKGQEVTEAIRETTELPYGIYVAAVESNSPAYKSGIQIGDIITGIDRKPVYTMDAFMQALSDHEPGDTLAVTVARKGRESYKEIEFSVILSLE